MIKIDNPLIIKKCSIVFQITRYRLVGIGNHKFGYRRACIGKLYSTLPANKPIALYCYTGQTSSFLAAYLRILGYDAKSILFGTNGMIYDKMVSGSIPNAFKSSEIMGYDYEK